MNAIHTGSRVAEVRSMIVSPLAIGDRLPELRGEFLTGREAVLPDAAGRRVALLLLGFTYEARFPVETWTKQFREQFGSDTRVTFYEVPVIGGLARLGKWFIDSGMRRGTPAPDYEHVVTVYRDAEQWKARLRAEDPNAAHLLLLDPAGRVVWRYSGVFDDAAYRALAAEITKLLNAE